MGAPMAANYANLFMDMYETSLLNDFQKKWKKTLNMVKFEISQSTKIINFWNVCITLNQQASSTTVFLKPTDTHIYFKP